MLAEVAEVGGAAEVDLETGELTTKKGTSQ